MSDAKPCTASAHMFAGPCGEPSVRRFVTALFPDGPELRLCDHHNEVFYGWCVEACHEDLNLRPKRRDEILRLIARMADEWRYSA